MPNADEDRESYS